MKSAALLLFLFLTAEIFCTGQTVYQGRIKWTGLEVVPGDESDSVLSAAFSGAKYAKETGGLPIFSAVYPLDGDPALIEAKIANPVYDIAPEGFNLISGIDLLDDVITVSTKKAYDRKMPVACCSFIPARINPYNGEPEILIAFDLVVSAGGSLPDTRQTDGNYIQNSVLATGTWYKLAVTETGIYRISYPDLQNFGINPSGIDPRNIRIYGNGGGMLPESLNEFRHDDLAENRIFVSGESDGKFDPDDYILFYGESPHEWKYQSFSQAFHHFQNIYSDSTYYFLTTGLGPGKRVVSVQSSNEPPDVYISRFTDYDYHEVDLINLTNIGRVWYGEVFDVNTIYEFPFSFPNIDLESQAYFRAYAAAKSESVTSFSFYDNGSKILSSNISGIPPSSNTYARAYIGSNWFTPSSSSLIIKAEFNKNISSSIGWLNFLELNVTRQLIFTGGQMSFREPSAASPGTIAEFALGNAGNAVQIWNVTDPTSASRIETITSGNGKLFRIAQDTMSEFIAFDGSNYLKPVYAGITGNQNLHGSGPQDMIIITHESFREQADRLAGFHREHDGLSVLVAGIEEVYNEFSSGAQDITAIRNFMKMLYDVAPAGQEPRYLLLFGDASFDYKDRIQDNSNLVPTWEDEESLVIVYSIASDDYYGFLDGPGDNLLDIGIGRLPVRTVEQATVAVDKIIHYATNTPEVMKEWRNYICFVADDEDGNLHIRQAEEMATFIDTTYGAYNIDKIYIDAFPQVSTPGGQRAPDVNRALNNRIDKGCLVMNYTGHGGEVGWGHERFLENTDINSWTNYDHMPIFITATCEFSRYDDPERISAGEYTFLNPLGGAIAMFTTARATFGGSNFNLNTALFDYMFEKDNGEHYRFGDLIRLAKNKGGVDANDKKFILLGDPALHLAYPEHEVMTTRINGEDISGVPDTLQALRKITIEGEVRSSGSREEGFNGTVYPIVFDKPSRVTTLAADQTSYQRTFDLQNNILYKGKAQVINGAFNFTFIVPRDIAYQYGFGKISYYAATENEDAHGFYRNILVGGLDASADPDFAGPEVSLYMNDENFRSGGVTDENPFMLAFVDDVSGINTVGSGIGHDIVAILDENTEKPIILNDFYESDLNSYSSGSIRFPFHGLDEGLHSLSLKVWDIFNNSSEAYIEFNVVRSSNFMIEELSNNPNPFREGTSIVFSHNRAEGNLEFSLDIFNLNGMIVRSFNENIVPAGYRTEAIYWDGRGSDGNALANGIYFCRIIVRNEEGNMASKTAKLILLR